MSREDGIESTERCFICKATPKSAVCQMDVDKCGMGNGEWGMGIRKLKM